MSERAMIRELISRYNKGTVSLNEEQVDRLATKAYQHGLKFKVEAKPFRKGMFDLADMATFGMLPNKWRPYSGGQDLYGERGIDRVAGGLGSLAGLVGGVGVATKVAPAVVGSFRSGRAADAIAKVKEAEAVKRADGIARSFYQGTVGRAQTFARDPLGMEKVFDFRNINMMP